MMRKLSRNIVDTFIRLLRLRRQGGRIIQNHSSSVFTLPSLCLCPLLGRLLLRCVRPVACRHQPGDFYFKATLLLSNLHLSETFQYLKHTTFIWGSLHFSTTSLTCQYLCYRDVKTVCAKCDLFQLHIQAAAKPIITVELNSEMRH